MAIKVHKAGLQTTVQDSGRSGYRKYGVANNGALDEYSHRLANWLVGKEKDSPTLEVTQIGPVLEFTTATTIGLPVRSLSYSLMIRLYQLTRHYILRLETH